MGLKLQSILTVFQIMLLSSTAYALDADFGKDTPSKEQILEIFHADDDATVSVGKTRNLIFVEKNDKRKLAHKPITPAPEEKAISMAILFAFGSANLTEKGKEQLRPVGSALAELDLKNKNFRIEGHTDIVGSDQFNNDLSRRRAEAVREFLVSEYGLPTSVLKIEGKGKKNLANPDEPTSEVNRRVRIVLIR